MTKKRVLVIYDNGWGLGDLLATDAALSAVRDVYDAQTEVIFYVYGHCGNIRYRPDVVLMGLRPPPVQSGNYDRTIVFRTYKRMGADRYALLENLPSHLDHMVSYTGLVRTGQTPNLHLEDNLCNEVDVVSEVLNYKRSSPCVAVCTDGNDLRRHYPVEYWLKVLELIKTHYPSIRLFQVGHGRTVKKNRFIPIIKNQSKYFDETFTHLDMRDTARVMSHCDLFLGSNSGLYQYAQAMKLPSLVVFGMHEPERYTFAKEVGNKFVVNPSRIPCIGCSNKSFELMLKEKCIAKTYAKCMLDISPRYFFDEVSKSLERLVTQRFS